MEKNFKSKNNIVFNCRYHVVFCPKRRKKVLVNGVEIRLKQIIENECLKINVDLLALSIMSDHVHLCLSIDPQFGIKKVIKLLKGISSHHLRKEFPVLLKLPCLWTNSYFVSTVGNVSSEKILEYIQNQWQK
jgi:putative transposase